MDFCKIKNRTSKRGSIEIFPEFQIRRSKDLMVRGKSFYAIWDEGVQLWSTDEYDVARIIDSEMDKYKEELMTKTDDTHIHVKYMSNFNSKSWLDFKRYVSNMSDNSKTLDSSLTFKNTKVKKGDHVSKRLPYNLEKGSIKHYEELMSVIYEPEERDKIEWAIGAIVSGDSKKIQKFLVLYGEGGTGKSTILNIINKMFESYTVAFNAKELTSSSNSFSTEMFKDNPLVAIQHDGDLSKIEDNSKFNSIISHEKIVVNEKFKPQYELISSAFVFMGTNKPVKITDGKSGIIRRLIDVKPSGKTIATGRYHQIMTQVMFELGAIAYYCLEKYKKMGKNYYTQYTPINMMFNTDVFYNFVEAHYFEFLEDDGVSLKRGYDLYKEYCSESDIQYKLPKYKFREEMKNYFREFKDKIYLNEQQMRNYYRGFIYQKFEQRLNTELEATPPLLVMGKTESLLDVQFANCSAQYATKSGSPSTKWYKNKSRLEELETTKLHYVKMPLEHIVIDFDLKDKNGNKSLELNMKAASKFPLTYSEVSKSGKGVHLHYTYEGDPTKLCRVYDDNIEIKVFVGDASLRRKLTKCNDLPINKISNDVLKERSKSMVKISRLQSEKSLRVLIGKNLKKEVHGGTKPSVDFIHKICEDAYNSGLKYDITDMKQAIYNFCMNSTNQSDYCLELFPNIKFKSEEISVNKEYDGELIFFDVEVFPNLFVICFKQQNNDSVVALINPTPEAVGELFDYRLVGFNNRKYDNHIMYARYMGYTNEQLFKLSKRIIGREKHATIGEAYNLSYTDVYDFASAGNKKSLKKWEIELGIHHKEVGFPWDEPVDEKHWAEVVEYCKNDVRATQAVFEHLIGDWTARQILAELSGLTVNDTTNRHSTKIIFGDEKNPQGEFVYTDLSKEFPGYKFSWGKSTYKGEDVGEGGWVWSKPGMYNNVGVLDVVSMHPTSIEELNLFGDRYTKRFSDLKKARTLIKSESYEEIKTILDGQILQFIPKIQDGEISPKDLSNGLKTVINSIYGLTSAKFDNPFRDPRNIDNIVAKRGALFMVDLKEFAENKGWKPIHVKTDSIKIPNITKQMIEEVMSFGAKYGYTFEMEDNYDKFCLVNDSVYIAKDSDGWHATGAQFAHPYVFKTCFSKEEVEFRDLCETKSVTTAIYLDFNEELGEEEHNYRFVGRVGSFCPVKEGVGGGILLREKEGKYSAVTGTKGYRWMEAEILESMNNHDDLINFLYFHKLKEEAIKKISTFGDFETFSEDKPPWWPPCGVDGRQCEECSDYHNPGDIEKCKQGFDILPF